MSQSIDSPLHECGSGHIWRADSQDDSFCPVCGQPALSREPILQKPWINWKRAITSTVVVIAMLIALLVVIAIRDEATIEDWAPVVKFPLLLLLVLLPIFVPVGLFLRRHLRQQRQASVLVAQRLGYVHCPDASQVLMMRLSPHWLFRRGRKRVFHDVIQGVMDGRESMAGVLTTFVKRGKNGRIYRQLLIVFPDAATSLPEFTLRPEHLGHRIFEPLIGKDIDITGTPTAVAFSRKYRVTGEDESAIRNVFTPSVQEYLSDTKGWSIFSSGGHLAFERSLKSQSWKQMWTAHEATVDPDFLIESWSASAVLTRHLTARQGSGSLASDVQNAEETPPSTSAQPLT